MMTDKTIDAGQTGEATVTGSGISRDEWIRRRRGRNIAIAVSLLGFVVLMYFITIAKLGPGVMERPL